MVDANHAYTAQQAIAVGRRLEALHIAWFEEPVAPENLDGYCEVKRALAIPVAGGENIFTRFGFREVLRRRAMDILQPDCAVTGGISEVRRIAALANVHGVRCLPHVWGSSIGVAAALQVVAGLMPTPGGLAPE